MDLHAVGEAFRAAVVPLIALLGLVHLFRIALTSLVLGRAGCCDQGGIHDRALTHRHPSLAQVILERFKDRLAQVVLLQQVAEAENRDLIRRWIAQRIPLLPQVDAQHRDQWIRRLTTLAAGFGVVGLDQRYHCLARHHHFHFG